MITSGQAIVETMTGTLRVQLSPWYTRPGYNWESQGLPVLTELGLYELSFKLVKNGPEEFSGHEEEA